MNPDTIKLWDWQEEAVEALRNNIRSGVKNQILAAPTGSGKTITSAYLIQEAQEKRTRSVFVCDRISLIDQTSAVFDQYGIQHGIIQADHWRWKPWSSVQLASAQTLARRKWPEDVGLIVVDECHTVHQSVVERIQQRDVVTIGLSATPFTRGLGKLYDAVVNVRTLDQLTAEGKLAPFEAYSASQPDMTGAAISAGEWTNRAAAERSMSVIGDAVAEYLEHAHGTKFIAFGATVDHCRAIQEQFLAAGIVTGLYTYRTSDAERAEMVEQFRERDSTIRGLISVAALSKGFDVPSVECIIMMRPLRSSFTEHIQILGRGLRRDPDNPDKKCIVLDHAGNMVRFWPDMVEFFHMGIHELDDGKGRKKRKKDPPEEQKARKCPRCNHVHKATPSCPMCGYEYPKKNRIKQVPGKLVAMANGRDGDGTMGELKQDIYSQLLYIVDERGYKEGWAAHKYRELFGVWPHSGLHKQRRRPTRKTRSWVKAQRIRFIKAKEAL